ncbi:MAG: hypothetical protein AAGU12_04185 [Clostridiales bacterium]
MRKYLISFLVLVLALALAGCGVKEKLEQKAAEALVEKVMEKSGSGDLDIDGDKVTVKGENGQEFTFGGGEWPTSDLAKAVPEFKDGDIISVMSTDEAVAIGFENVKEEDVVAYFEKIKKDFKENVVEINSDDVVIYGAENTDGISVALQYSENSFSITLSKNGE